MCLYSRTTVAARSGSRAAMCRARRAPQSPTCAPLSWQPADLARAEFARIVLGSPRYAANDNGGTWPIVNRIRRPERL
jgi:hypothetical protein